MLVRGWSLVEFTVIDTTDPSLIALRRRAASSCWASAPWCRLTPQPTWSRRHETTTRSSHGAGRDAGRGSYAPKGIALDEAAAEAATR
ncbi:MAG: hypothetical protein U5K43_15490 [Halofilum sp. (in: g-proteobacteria)]|nr:hypothetical protein [Halofilum sp. (in: g-proteobacteria)]